MKPEQPNASPSTSAQVTLSIDEAFDLAFKLHQEGYQERAEMLYRRVIDAAPEHLNSLHFYSLLCHQQQRYQESAELIRRIIAIAPDNADAHSNLGNVLEGMGRKADAEACYRQAIAIDAAHAPAYNNLGVLLMARCSVDEALEVYAKAVELAPESADYHNNQANALRKCGRIDDALTAYRRAVELDAAHLGAWQGLSRTLIKAGRRDEAMQVFDAWLAKDPENPIALYLQASCKGQGAPGRAPDAFVQTTFDNMAASFDEHLQDNLGYRAPQLLMDALADLLPPPDSSLDILDAGCGTGLCGPLLRPYARRLVGVDLSAGMLVRARGVGVYDELAQAELTAYLQDQSHAYDVIVCADTLCYFGDLEPVLTAAAGALKPDGCFAFTLEAAGSEDETWLLNQGGRYAHARNYVERLLGSVGFSLQRINSMILRKEGGAPVYGHLVVTTM